MKLRSNIARKLLPAVAPIIVGSPLVALPGLAASPSFFNEAVSVRSVVPGSLFLANYGPSSSEIDDAPKTLDPVLILFGVSLVVGAVSLYIYTQPDIK
jgi:hypothetical protein